MSTFFNKFSESFKKPLITSGNIAVWPAKELKNGRKIYNVSFKNADNERNYISVFANIAGQELKPEEVLTLATGKTVRIEDESQYGPRICTIVNRGNLTKINGFCRICEKLRDLVIFTNVICCYKVSL